MTVVLYVLMGGVAGIVSGLMGIGGGTILIPLMIYLFGMSQHEAQGTTLAIMIPPIGLLAAWVYYKKGFVNIPMAVFVCLGFLIGGFLGAKAATVLSNEVLRRIFAAALIVIAVNMLFSK
jgi:uncharacterized membrane protein YfcA